jgi:hypothetical protein
MLSYGLAEVTGRPVNLAAITAFSIGQSAIMLAVMFAIAAVLIAREFGTRSPRRVVQRARLRLHGSPFPLGEAPGVAR